MMLTPADLERMRREHVAVERHFDRDSEPLDDIQIVCSVCFQYVDQDGDELEPVPWPCDAAKLLDLVDMMVRGWEGVFGGPTGDYLGGIIEGPHDDRPYGLALRERPALDSTTEELAR